MIESNESDEESNVSTVDLNQYFVKRIISNRTRPRIYNGYYYGALAFDIVWDDNTISREPIQNLINKETNEVNEHIIDIINDYKIKAQLYPRHNRMCIMCLKKVHNGAFMCNNHSLQYYFLIE